MALGLVLQGGCGARSGLYVGNLFSEPGDAAAVDAADDGRTPESAVADASDDFTAEDGGFDTGSAEAGLDAAIDSAGLDAQDAADAQPEDGTGPASDSGADRDAGPGADAGADADATVGPDAGNDGGDGSIDADAGDGADAPPDACDGPCPPPAPRPISPTTGCAVSTHTPTLTWLTPAGYGLVHLDVCADRACSNILWSQDVAGNSVTVGTSLPSGYVYWRLFTRDSDGGASSPASPTWQFAVLGTHSASIMSSWTNFHDLEGDGFSDLLVYGGPSSLALQEYKGSTNGIVSTGLQLGASAPLWAAAGDVNGDGFGDVVAMVTASQTLHLVTYFGGPGGPQSTGFATPMLATLPAPQSEGGFVADVNGDGYADWVSVDQVNGAPSISVFFGSAGGLSGATQTVALPAGTGSEAFAYYAGDVNADGYPDVLVTDPTLPDDGGTLSGQAYLYFGGASGLGGAPSQTIARPLRPGCPAGSGGGGTVFGTSATFGDIDGDGYGDVQIGDSAGVAYYYPGSPTGLLNVNGGDPACTGFRTANATSVLGLGGGDIDGDGLCDVAVGEFPNGGGQAVEVAGQNAIVQTACRVTPFAPANLGDTNGDSLSDFAVSWAGGAADSGVPTAGVGIFYGSASLVANVTPAPGPSATLDNSGRAF